MPLGIDPKVDFAFKLMLGNPSHPAVTIHFLNAVLQPLVPITEVQILNPIQGRDRSDDKLVVLDILAKDSVGRLFNIEMQTTLPVVLRKRLTFYNCLNYVRQISQGDGYGDLNPAISICVIDRVIFRQEPRYHLSFRLRCDQTDLVFINDLEFHTLELPKFHASLDNVAGLAPQEKWLYLLQHAAESEPEQLSKLLGDPEFREAVGVLEMISKSPEDLQFYEARQKFLRDVESNLTAARQESRQEGREEGREEGRQKGLQEGVLAGQIQLLQQFLEQEVTSLDELSARAEAEMRSMLSELQEQLRSREQRG